MADRIETANVVETRVSGTSLRGIISFQAFASSAFRLTRKRIFTSLSVGFAIASIACVVTANPVDAKKSSKKTTTKNVGWVLEQISEEAGRGEIVVTTTGVRIKLKNLTAILTAPKFDATIFDTGTQKYVEMPYAQWTAKYRDKRPPVVNPTGREDKVAGLKVTCFRVPSKKVLKEVWFTQDIPISEDMCTFIATTMHLPSGHGLPVRMDIYRPGGKRNVFDTLKVTKSDDVDAKIFQCPTGFKKVDSEYQLFVKESQVKDMGGFFQ